MHVTFDHSEPVAAHIETFWFRPVTAINYTAGQFTELKLPHANADARGEKRWFTLSSSPTEKLLAITTKFSDPGSSFKQHLKNLTAGTELQLADAMGDFVLPKDPAIPIIFVAGGMGITPMRSMVKWLVDTGEQRDVTLMYAVRDEAELAFMSLFESYCRHIIVHSPKRSQNYAPLDAKKILSLTKPSADARVYLSGPEPMVESLVDQLQALGFDNGRLLTDYFPGYAPV